MLRIEGNIQNRGALGVHGIISDNGFFMKEKGFECYLVSGQFSNVYFLKNGY